MLKSLTRVHGIFAPIAAKLPHWIGEFISGRQSYAGGHHVENGFVGHADPVECRSLGSNGTPNPVTPWSGSQSMPTSAKRFGSKQTDWSSPAPADFLQLNLKSGLLKDGQMKRARFTEEQSIGVLREHEVGAKTSDLARKYGVSEATIL